MISDHYYYHRLTPKNQSFYKTLYDGLIKLDKYIMCMDPAFTPGDLDEIYNAIYFDNPYLFFLGNSIKVEGNALGLLKVTPEYLFSDDEIQDLRSKIERNTTKLLSRADLVDGDHYNNVKKLYELLCENIEYDRTISDSLDDVDSYYSHSILGIILRKKGVCSGVSRTFKYLLNAIGIPSIVVIGRASETEFMPSSDNHAWNIVKIDGNNYHLDLTWDSCLSHPGLTAYDYFFITDDEISIDHTGFEGMPNCSDDSLGFFFQKGSYITEMRGIDNIISNALKQSLARIYFKCPKDIPVNTILENVQNSVFDKLLRDGKSADLSVRTNLRQNIVDIRVN
ncbi:MAG: hypothetical protein IJI23_05755 [Lachnospiraceae bacterium]|nr:hypothetical protein [Lachnospiraceae bacterium]